MNIKINGEAVAINPGNISDLLVQRKVKMPDMVTVEHNGQVLHRDVFPTTQLSEGDSIEFLYFMGGGSVGDGALTPESLPVGTSRRAALPAWLVNAHYYEGRT